MTKKVRIENADNATHYNVVVRVFDKIVTEDGPNQVLVEERVLRNPTDLAEFYIHNTRYITISEN